MSERIRVTFQWITVGTILSLAALLYHAGKNVQAVESTTIEHTHAIEEIRTTIKSIPVIETDIKWIRQSLERQEQKENTR